MSKNIIICCDGTNNQFSGDHTNVIRTYKVAVRSATQVTYYDCGVGTMPDPWSRGRMGKRWSMVKGLAFGDGFMENIADAYRFLMQNYQPEDRIYLFGFSRGAYTARALAGMLHSVGLLRPGAEALVRYAQRYWQKDHPADGKCRHPGGGQQVCAEFKATLAQPCPVHFIGVWDTVGSVGFINQFRTFPHTYCNPEVGCVRHAVSIDERRSCFRQNLMMAAHKGQDVKNVWFAGVHSDVGGGYPAGEAGLARITFEWMMREAGTAGMQIDPTMLEQELAKMEPPQACPNGHESLQGGWRLVELIPVYRYNYETRQKEWRVSLGARRNIGRDVMRAEVYLHQSVRDRLSNCPSYRPGNLQPDPMFGGTFKIEE